MYLPYRNRDTVETVIIDSFWFYSAETARRIATLTGVSNQVRRVNFA